MDPAPEAFLACDSSGGPSDLLAPRVPNTEQARHHQPHPTLPGHLAEAHKATSHLTTGHPTTYGAS